MPTAEATIPRLSNQGHALLAILVAHIKQPGVSGQRLDTLISYGEALEELSLPTDAPARTPTGGRSSSTVSTI